MEYSKLELSLRITNWLAEADDKMVAAIKDEVANRRRAVIVAAGIASVLVIALSSLAVSGFQAPNQREVRTGPVANGEGSETSAGYRSVSAMGLVFQVPDAWGYGDAACDGSPTKDTVVFGGSGTRGCLVPDPPRVSSLQILRTGSDVGAVALDVARRAPEVEFGNVAANVSPLADDPSGWTFAVHVEGEDAVVLVTTQDRSDGELIQDTIDALPVGRAAVPSIQTPRVEDLTEDIESVGLRPVMKAVKAPGFGRGAIVSTRPVSGTILSRGDSVIVVIASRK